MPHLMGIVVIVGFPRPRRVVGQLELLLEVRWGSHIMEATSMIHSGISMMIHNENIKAIYGQALCKCEAHHR